MSTSLNSFGKLKDLETKYIHALQGFLQSRTRDDFQKLRLADVNYQIVLKYLIDQLPEGTNKSLLQTELQKQQQELAKIKTFIITELEAKQIPRKGIAKKLPKKGVPLSDKERKQFSISSQMEMTPLDKYLLKNYLSLIQIVDKNVPFEEKDHTYYMPSPQQRADLRSLKRIISIVEGTTTIKDIHNKDIRYWMARTIDTNDLKKPPTTIAYLYVPESIIRFLESQGSLNAIYVLDRIVALVQSKSQRQKKFSQLLRIADFPMSLIFCLTMTIRMQWLHQIEIFF